MSNPKNTQVVQPNDLTEAFRLASDYNNVKGNRMTLASPSPGNTLVGTIDSSDPKALKLALAAIEKKQAAVKQGNNKISSTPPATTPHHTPAKTTPAKKVRFTDPKHPPPAEKAWDNMQYCTHCKAWGKHTVDHCRKKNTPAGLNVLMPSGHDSSYDEEFNSLASVFSF
jgi:hypothetical protein